MPLTPRSGALAALVAAVAAILATVGSPARCAPFSAPFVPGELIVGFRDGAPASARAAAHAAAGAREVVPIARGAMELVRFGEDAELGAIERAYLERPDVEFADRNYIGEGGFTPNDSNFSFQWQHRNTGQSGGTPGADVESVPGWDLARGGSSVTVAVLDSGIDSDHPEFAGRILPGWDFVNGDADPEDDHSHGTFVAGLLAANADNGFSVAGVDHFCRILPVKVLNASNGGTSANLISGIDYASAQGADVLSMSLINYPCTPSLNMTLNAAKTAGAILVACAGNGGIGDADVSCPGASVHTISIGASTHTDARASYSGTGEALEFLAPGHQVVTVRYNTAADGSTSFSGCSAATPVAAGIVAIVRALAPEMRTNRMRELLRLGAEDQVGPPEEDTPGRDEFFGWGRLNLRLVLEEFLAATAAPQVAGGAPGVALEIDPNPARAANGAAIRYELPARAWVKVEVLDVAGRLVRVVDHGIRDAGARTLVWDARHDRGNPVASGVYFVRLSAGSDRVVRKLTLAR